MARYIVTNIVKNRFVGWDTIDGKSTEATRSKDLSVSMPQFAKRLFPEGGAGQLKIFGGFSLFREW